MELVKKTYDPKDECYFIGCKISVKYKFYTNNFGVDSSFKVCQIHFSLATKGFFGNIQRWEKIKGRNKDA